MDDEKVLAFIQSAVDLADARFGKRLDDVEERLTSRITAEVRTIRTDMAAMEQRLQENIQSRREDINAAFGDIDALRRAVRDLDKRVESLEAR